jgi:hypothetical protein
MQTEPADQLGKVFNIGPERVRPWGREILCRKLPTARFRKRWELVWQLWVVTDRSMESSEGFDPCSALRAQSRLLGEGRQLGHSGDGCSALGRRHRLRCRRTSFGPRPALRVQTGLLGEGRRIPVGLIGGLGPTAVSALPANSLRSVLGAARLDSDSGRGVKKWLGRRTRIGQLRPLGASKTMRP